jgi:nucleotide-binding universal stress UspA family protein
VLKTIVVPLDGSAFAQRSLPYAEVLARRASAKVILLRAIEGGYSPGARAMAHHDMRQAQQELAFLSNRLQQQGIQTVAQRPFDEASWAIITAAQEEHADLIVMSTHGRTGMGRFVYGSVAERVLRVAPAPMLMVPASATFNWPSEPEKMRIVVPLDGSEVAQGILDTATEVAEATGGTMVLVQAFLPESPTWAGDFGDLGYAPAEIAETIRASLAPIAAGLKARGIRSELYVHEGQAHNVILDAVAVHQAHLIAMSTHGRTGLARLIMGSVADAVLRETRVALLLARPPSSALTADEEALPEADTLPHVPELQAAPEDEPIAVLMTPFEVAVTAMALRGFVDERSESEETAMTARELLERMGAARQLLPSAS